MRASHLNWALSVLLNQEDIFLVRNTKGLDEDQIEYIQLLWDFLTQVDPEQESYFDKSKIQDLRVRIDVSEAHLDKSKTAFLQDTNTIRIGADALPSAGQSMSANDTMSELACLAHEYAHAIRYHLGYRRPFKGALMHLDEAETSIHASYETALSDADRKQLVEDASERIANWRVS
ncbi:hypothetical protein [Vibrio owensii]|uniref:hypothetical protein n=1 Tax=Vibrio owensii TaxID=696485 RepID=UPI00215CB6AF|nr:hypothetical protein [Vibrio owensii]MCR9942004.1 hypothetical protein [Vibrio owensii]